MIQVQAPLLAVSGTPSISIRPLSVPVPRIGGVLPLPAPPVVRPLPPSALVSVTLDESLLSPSEVERRLLAHNWDIVERVNIIIPNRTIYVGTHGVNFLSVTTDVVRNKVTDRFIKRYDEWKAEQEDLKSRAPPTPSMGAPMDVAAVAPEILISIKVPADHPQLNSIRIAIQELNLQEKSDMEPEFHIELDE